MGRLTLVAGRQKADPPWASQKLYLERDRALSPGMEATARVSDSWIHLL
jgi:hypothetical protein